MNLFRKVLKVYQKGGWEAVLKAVKVKIFWFFRNPFDFLLIPLAKRKIKSLQYDGSNKDELINFAMNGFWGIFKLGQIKEEISTLLDLFVQAKPKVILEIGSELGGSLFLFTKMAGNDVAIISIDLPRNEGGIGYQDWRVPLLKSFTRGDQQLHLLKLNSHKESTLQKLREILNGTSVDFLFIDGDHSYEGVKKDFEMYGPLVRNGGTIVFHDIAYCPDRTVNAVPIFWQEIKNNHKHKEFVKDWQQGGLGIGVILK